MSIIFCDECKYWLESPKTLITGLCTRENETGMPMKTDFDYSCPYAIERDKKGDQND